MRNLFTKFSIVALFSSLSVAYGQNAAAVTGTVTDSSGAVLPGTTVTLTNPSRGTRLSQVTTGEGTYRFANVPPAQGYVETFSHTGFADTVVKDVALLVGITRTQNAALAVGANQAVDVSAGNNEVTLNTTDASVGNNIDVQLLTELPIQSRSNPTALFTLQPGVAASSVTGARTDQSSVTLDGMDVNDISTGQTFNINGGGAPVDSVQEFRAVVGGLTPNLGTGSGGQFQLVTKSGTNHFHGNLNEYHRDTTTTANTWFNNHTGLRRTPLIQNQFGGNLGGPVLKDKLFFFADFNNSRIIRSSSSTITVPLDSYRAGNINYIYATQGGVAGATPCTASSRLNTTPSCIGTLTPAQVAALDPQKKGFSPAISNLLTRLPHANDLTGGDGVNTGYFRFTSPTPNIQYQGVGRVDYNITPKQRVFVRFTKAQQDSIQQVPFLPTDPLTSPFQDRSYGFVASHTWQIGQNKVNQAYYGDTITVFNFANTFNPTGVNQYSVGGTTAGAFLSGPFAYSNASSQRRRIPIPEIRDDFNWTLGNHNIGFGGTFKFIKTNSQLINDFNGVSLGLGGELLTLDSSVRPANIRGGVTAPNDYDGAFAFALGRIASIGSNYNYTNAGTALPNGTGETRRYRYYQTELYFGDAWKVSPHFTLNYGVRYQLYTVPYEANGAESIQNTTFDGYFNARRTQSGSSREGAASLPFVTYNLGGKANNAAPLYNPSYKDFAPRLAFSWNPTYLPKTVFNGSAAIVYDRTVINAVNFIQDQSSYLFQNSANTQYGGQNGATANLLADPRIGTNLAFTNPNVAPTITKPFTPFVDNTGAPFGLANNQFNTIVDPTLKDPYSIQLNAGVQQEFAGNLIMRLNYVGRLGRRLLAQADGSQLVDFRDPTSGQLMSTAFANLTRQARAGQAYTAQPWFENQVAPGYTVALANALSTLVYNGDFADFIQALQANGFLDYNVGMASQFAENTYLTNKGFSSYNGLLLNLTKNMSHGFRFDFNYTFSHSIDNTSAVANFIAGGSGFGFVCDATRPRECRANSDFDITHVINSDFTFQLPFGRGRAFASHTPIWLDEVIGGWSVDGLPAWQSGTALSAYSSAFVAGYANDAPATLIGNRETVAGHVRQDASKTVYLFKDHAAAQNSFQGPIGFDIGNRNILRGPRAFTMDAGLAKRFILLPSDRLNLQFRADFFNVLNHPVFSNPTMANLDFTSGTFGQITSTTSPRIGQFSLRLEF